MKQETPGEKDINQKHHKIVADILGFSYVKKTNLKKCISRKRKTSVMIQCRLKPIVMNGGFEHRSNGISLLQIPFKYFCRSGNNTNKAARCITPADKQVEKAACAHLGTPFCYQSSSAVQQSCI